MLDLKRFSQAQIREKKQTINPWLICRRHILSNTNLWVIYTIYKSPSENVSGTILSAAFTRVKWQIRDDVSRNLNISPLLWNSLCFCACKHCRQRRISTESIILNKHRSGPLEPPFSCRYPDVVKLQQQRFWKINLQNVH